MFAIVRSGQPVELPPRKPFVDESGTQHHAMVLSMWSAAELAAIGVYEIVDDEIPVGKTATGSSLEFIGTGVLRHFALIDTPPAAVPSSVTKFQFKAAVLAANKSAEAQTAINSASALQKLEWSDARKIRRDSDLVAYLKSALSLTDAQIDNFFRSAAQIQD